MPKALSTAVKAAEHSTIRARQWAGFIADAGRDTDNPVLRQWGQRLRDAIHDSDLAQYLTCLINDAHLDNATLAIALAERGYSHRLAGHGSKALADLNRAIELNLEYAWAIGSRGATHQAMERYDALTDLKRAIELNPHDDFTAERIAIHRLT